MKKNSFLWAALSMTAALVMTACSNDDNDVTEIPQTPSTSKTIPYTVTVSGEEATTRATVDDDNKTLRFATGDKLYITGTDIQGVLDLKSGDEGKTSDATFSGTLTYSGSGSPSDGLSLTATLVSAQQTVGSQVSVDGVGAVTVNYPTAAYCTSVNDAVQQYSKLTGTSTYGAKAFSLTQQTAFLNFVITFDDNTASSTELSAVVSNNSSTICTANVTTTTENGNVVAKFVLPVASSTTLTSPTVKMGDKDAISFSGATLSPKVYNVKRTQLHPSAISGKFSVSSTKKVYFSKGNLQATTSNSGSSWTWAFATNQWDKVGAAAANTSITANKTVSTNGTVDLFGWSTGATYLGINKTNNNNAEFEGTFNDWGKHADVIAGTGIGSGWRTLTGGEWDYLFTERSTTSNLRFCKAKIGDCFGVILLPDDWSTTYYDLFDCNETTSRNFADNTINNKISIDDWTNKLEAHGAVFLPCTGQRNGGNVVNAPNGQVHYWSASKGTTDTGSSANANHARADGNGVAPNTGAGRSNGFSVRLVRDVK